VQQRAKALAKRVEPGERDGRRGDRHAKHGRQAAVAAE
jgi:hypothetical protein